MRRFTLVFFTIDTSKKTSEQFAVRAIALIEARDPDHARYIARDLAPDPKSRLAIELGDTRPQHPGAQEIIPSIVPNPKNQEIAHATTEK